MAAREFKGLPPYEDWTWYRLGDNEVWTKWYMTDRPQIQEIRQNGRRNGLFTEWYRNGFVKSQGEYRLGSKEGEWKEWGISGTLLSTGSYRNDKREGEWWFYDLQGYKKLRGSYRNDLRTGRWMEWRPDGSVRSEGNYVEDRKEGTWREDNRSSFYYHDRKIEEDMVAIVEEWNRFTAIARKEGNTTEVRNLLQTLHLDGVPIPVFPRQGSVLEADGVDGSILRTFSMNRDHEVYVSSTNWMDLMSSDAERARAMVLDAPRSSTPIYTWITHPRLCKNMEKDTFISFRDFLIGTPSWEDACSSEAIILVEIPPKAPSLTVDGKIVVPSRSVFRVVNQFRGALSSCPQNQCGKVIHIRLQGLFTPDKTVEVDREGNFYYYGPTDGEIFIDGDNQF